VRLVDFTLHFMHVIRKIWNWLLARNLIARLPAEEVPSYRVANAFCLIALFATISMGAGPLNLVGHSAPVLIALHTINTTFILALIIAFALVRYQRRSPAMVLSCIAGNAFAALLSFSIPDEPIYLIAFALMMMPFLLHAGTGINTRYALSILPMVWFLTYQVYFKVLGGEAFFGPLQWVIPADRLVPPVVLVLAVTFVIVQQFVSAVDRAESKLRAEHAKSEELLLNILPRQVADELKAGGAVEPLYFDSATICFTDFQGFTKIAESMLPHELVEELDRCFSYFDSLMDRHGLEKLKTIGDSYMFAGGIPIPGQTHAIDCVLAALEIQAFMNQIKEIKKSQGMPYWELRLGIHTGDLVAGVIGEKKFAYDVWSDTVNTASPCESSGLVGRINVSKSTYECIKDFFDCEFRGAVPAKHKGQIEMYFVNGLLPEFQQDGQPRVPNAEFQERYNKLANPEY